MQAILTIILYIYYKNVFYKNIEAKICKLLGIF